MLPLRFRLWEDTNNSQRSKLKTKTEMITAVIKEVLSEKKIHCQWGFLSFSLTYKSQRLTSMFDLYNVTKNIWVYINQSVKSHTFRSVHHINDETTPSKKASSNYQWFPLIAFQKTVKWVFRRKQMETDWETRFLSLRILCVRTIA